MLWITSIFIYKDKEYAVCLINDKYCTGEAGNNEFDSFDNMANKWMIQGKLLKGIIEDIEVL